MSKAKKSGRLSRTGGKERAWCIVDGEDGCFLLWADKEGPRLVKITAYLFDGDGIVYREPVSSWYVFCVSKSIPRSRMVGVALGKFSRSIASYGSSPFDYRDQTVALNNEPGS